MAGAAPVNREAPRSIEAEESLLGALLINRAAIPAAADLLAAEDFYRPIHGHIFDAIVSLYGAGEPADPATVADELGRANLLEAVGGLAAILSLVANTPASSNAESYARIIRRHAVYRGLVAASLDIRELGLSGEGDADEGIDQAEQILHRLADRARRTRDVQHLGASLHDWIERIEARCARDAPEGVPTGWKDLDGYLAGLRGGQLLTVAARPGMGKSLFAGGMTIQVARAGHPVLFVSVEMGLAELQDRFLATITKVGLDPIRKGQVTEKDWHRIYAGFPPVLDLPVYVEDDPDITVLGVRAAARRVAARAGRIGMVVVDYIQLVNSHTRFENRQVEVADISRSLKKMALELDVPVVSMAQLNRNVELRGNQGKRPQLSDLRESGAIENDSDVVMFLYRDEVYNPESNDRGICEVIIAKQRNGPTGTVKLAFDARYGKFSNLAHEF